MPDGKGEEAVTDMRAKGFRGLSVTMPHKAAAARAVDELSPTAAKLGVVNCVRREGDRLIGENTDGIGFLDGLRAQTNIEPDGLRVVIVGAGGAARSVALTLAEHGANIGVSNRTRIVRRPSPPHRWNFISGGTRSHQRCRPCNQRNTSRNERERTYPHRREFLGTGQCVVDLIYKPEKQSFDRSRSSRPPSAQRVRMLLFRGEQFRLWTDQKR